MVDDKTDKLSNILSDEEKSGAFKIAVSLEAQRLTQDYECQISRLENKIYELSEDKEELARNWENQYHDMKRKYEESKNNVDDYALERLDRVTDINKELEKNIRELKEELADKKRVISNLHYNINDREETISELENNNKRAYTIEELSEIKEILFPTAIVRDKLNRRIEE